MPPLRQYRTAAAARPRPRQRLGNDVRLAFRHDRGHPILAGPPRVALYPAAVPAAPRRAAAAVADHRRLHRPRRLRPADFGTAPAGKTAPAPAPLAAVRVVDGDTLHAGDRRIRLIGIDAPEKAQTCRDAQGQSWACGLAATARLEALVAHGPVACAPQGNDRYGRTLAVCSAGDVADVGRALVREGYAVSDMSRGGGYLAEEDAARDEGAGLWRGAFERPADWRRRHRPAG